MSFGTAVFGTDDFQPNTTATFGEAVFGVDDFPPADDFGSVVFGTAVFG